jgi:hypothetical protein
MGGDSFEVRFEKGAQLWSIALSPAGKVASVFFSPAPPPPAAK